MMSVRDEGPVYYREIQKNAYLKRIPTEPSGKLRPLGHKKPPLKPMWTLFCVHNGRTPFLEQYPSPEAPATLTHKPAWRACLKTARHVTASVKPHTGDEYDFLVDTDQGPVRMLAPDWDSMQDWVSTLRGKLHELKILSKGENVYTAPAQPPAPRAGTRDPTSPLPPTPPVPPDRVPGIELTTPSRAIEQPTEPQPQPIIDTPPEPIDISHWDEPEPFTSLPSTSQDIPKTTKICGQNICLDDSVLRRSNTDSDEEFFTEIDPISEEVEGAEVKEYKQTVVVEATADESQSDYQGTNITVIQVSNKEPPHTAIPVLGPETDIFNFDLQQLTMEPKENYINIVNTESNTHNGYGTVYKESDYGHISLTTTVNLTGEKSLYERLCQASTSTERSPLPVRRVKALEKVRKSSLPNMETYEYLYPGNSNNSGHTLEVNSVNVHSASNGTSAVQDSVTVNADSSVRPVRPVERSHSNACESRTHSPKRERSDKNQELNQGKPIWKRGLTELSLLSRLRGLGQGRRQDSPTRHDDDRSATVAVKVVRRSRPDGRVDGIRRRSSSLSNEHSPPSSRLPPGLRPLRQRQAAALRAEQRRGAAVASSVPAAHPPTFVDYNRSVWIARWGGGGAWCGGRPGDRVAALRGASPRDAQHARTLFKEARARTVDILFHRVPLGKIYVLNKRDHEKLGIKLDSECNITHVEASSVCARAGLPPPGRWALTEVNNQPLSLLKGSEDEMNRIAAHGTEVSILIQPSALVKKIRAALKTNKTLLGLR